jgi:phycobilisome rod-core linker protein
MSWVRSMPALRGSAATGSADIDYLAKVPYRSLGR